MFHWIWAGTWTVLLLPCAVALTCGWVPGWLRRRAALGDIRVRGVAGLVMYVSALVPAVTALSDMHPADADLVRTLLSPSLLFLALGLVAGSGLRARFDRRAAARPAAHIPDIYPAGTNK